MVLGVFSCHNQAPDHSLGSLGGYPIPVNAEAIYLDAKLVRNLEGLSKFQSARILSFASNELRDIEEVRTLQNVEELNINGNAISDLSPTAALKKLRVLRASHMSTLTDIRDLRSARRLEELDIQFTSVENVAPLASLTKLKILNIAGTKITDIQSLPDSLRTLIVGESVSRQELSRYREKNPDCWTAYQTP